jgi:hypothetical protein
MVGMYKYRVGTWPNVAEHGFLKPAVRQRFLYKPRGMVTSHFLLITENHQSHKYIIRTSQS